MKTIRNSFVVSKPARPCRLRREVLPPLPRRFDFGLTSSHPLVPLPAVTLFLDKSAREVLKLIESGQIRWAFDIRSAGASLKQVRVFRRSIFEYAGFIERNHTHATIEARETKEVLEIILPKGILCSAHANLLKPAMQDLQRKLRIDSATFQKMLFPNDHVMRAAEVAHCFSCNNQHVINLIRRGTLKWVQIRQGPKSSPLVTRTSVVEFLKQRRMS
jgi:hypothetical protein